VVVIGAGLGGLAAAARLSALGHRVTVLEQGSQVGGKLGRLEREGHVFDTGPSLVTLPQVYRDLFDATGGPLEGEVDLVRLDPAVHYRFADGTTLAMPGDLDAVPRALDEALGAGCGAQWAALVQRAAAMWQISERPFLRTPLQGAATLARLARTPADVATIAPWQTLRGLGAAYLRHPHLRTLLDRYATYSGSDPRRAPAVLATVPYVEQAFGSWYVRGGLHRLGTAVAERAVERGAVLRLGCSVRRVLVAGGRAAGVELADGERVPADVVVSGADATALYAHLVPRDPWPPAGPGTGHAVPVRRRPAARPARPHAGPGAPHRPVPRRLRRRVRRGLRPRRTTPAGRRPDGLHQRPGRPGAATRRRQ
jgi:phytoene desaturase